MLNKTRIMFVYVILVICLTFIFAECSVRTLAQPLVQFPAQTTNIPGNTITNASDTFSILGTASDIYSFKSQKYILSGNWTMNVNHGRTSNFIVNLFAVLTNGSRFHSHGITNFRQSNDTMVQLNPNNSVVIQGIADVGFNKNPIEWPNVITTISINNGKAISIKLDNNQTAGHFADQPVYGIVKSIVKSITVTSKINNT
jgi:hypothetical protein